MRPREYASLSLSLSPVYKCSISRLRSSRNIAKKILAIHPRDASRVFFPKFETNVYIDVVTTIRVVRIARSSRKMIKKQVESLNSEKNPPFKVSFISFFLFFFQITTLKSLNELCARSFNEPRRGSGGGVLRHIRRPVFRTAAIRCTDVLRQDRRMTQCIFSNALCCVSSGRIDPPVSYVCVCVCVRLCAKASLTCWHRSRLRYSRAPTFANSRNRDLVVVASEKTVYERERDRERLSLRDYSGKHSRGFTTTRFLAPDIVSRYRTDGFTIKSPRATFFFLHVRY